jgi:hypothetical protein
MASKFNAGTTGKMFTMEASASNARTMEVMERYLQEKGIISAIEKARRPAFDVSDLFKPDGGGGSSSGGRTEAPQQGSDSQASTIEANDFTRLAGDSMAALALLPVRPGDLITASYINAMVDALLGVHRRLAHVEDYLAGLGGAPGEDEAPEEDTDDEKPLAIRAGVYLVGEDGRAIGVVTGANLERADAWAVASSTLATAKRKAVEVVGEGNTRAFLFASDARGGILAGAAAPVLFALANKDVLASKRLVAATGRTQQLLAKALKAKDASLALEFGGK